MDKALDKNFINLDGIKKVTSCQRLKPQPPPARGLANDANTGDMNGDKSSSLVSVVIIRR
jgi:hypothetical protein